MRFLLEERSVWESNECKHEFLNEHINRIKFIVSFIVSGFSYLNYSISFEPGNWTSMRLSLYVRNFSFIEAFECEFEFDSFQYNIIENLWLCGMKFIATIEIIIYLILMPHFIFISFQALFEHKQFWMSKRSPITGWKSAPRIRLSSLCTPVSR